ncbi:DUF3576 domain-containing protein [Candidatus Pelagibacter sp. HIMB1542]|uniref:DUF3576 domain-containing protein n=1 Tax=Candidatus Pelagibacter sp. HIMB1542 TaxID=3413346 RepID=UPI003F870948
MKIFFKILALLVFVSACESLPGGDAKKNPPNPRERVKNNLEQGKGFRLSNAIKNQGGNFQFASSNELWRASLDVIDFMPLASANYSGGMIITDWYSDGKNTNESIKITIRFLSNEIRSDALNIKVFYKNCDNNLNCSINEKKGTLSKELQKNILKLATKYKKNKDTENFKPYTGVDILD